MKRINETESARAFIEKVNGGFYSYDRSINTEVDYPQYKEDRDTVAVKEFATTSVFAKFVKKN